MSFTQALFLRVRALAEEELPLWEELWNYIRDKYLSMNLQGRYEHLDVSNGGIVTVRNIILGLFIGIVIAAIAATVDKNHLGEFVRKLIYEECYTAESAKTLAELGYRRSPAVRGSLKRGSVLGKIVHCVEREAYERDEAAAREAYVEAHGGSDKGFSMPPFHMDTDEAHFYIPQDEKYAAEVRFERGRAGGLTLALVVIFSVVGAGALLLFMPDILQLVDNLIGILKG